MIYVCNIVKHKWSPNDIASSFQLRNLVNHNRFGHKVLFLSQPASSMVAIAAHSRRIDPFCWPQLQPFSLHFQYPCFLGCRCRFVVFSTLVATKSQGFDGGIGLAPGRESCGELKPTKPSGRVERFFFKSGVCRAVLDPNTWDACLIRGHLNLR